MNAYCPDCETELDQATGICPACRWDPLLGTAAAPVASSQPQASLTEQYRGTEFDMSSQLVASRNGNVSRGRTFVIIGLLVAAGLYGIVLGVLGMV
jgi:hypothetical protein